MSLRDDVDTYFTQLGKLFVEVNIEQAKHCVLKFIDRHEAEQPWPHCTRCGEQFNAASYHPQAPCVCPDCWLAKNVAAQSDERPARDKLWQHNDDTGNGVLLYGLSALVEAIDALTAALKAGTP